MEYTENLELPLCEDTDNMLNVFTQGNEISNKVEEKLGTYEDTVEALGGLTETVTDLNTDYENFKDNTADTIGDINTSIGAINDNITSLDTRVTKLENGVIKSNVLDDTKKIDYYAVNFTSVLNFSPAEPLQARLGINSEPLNTPLDLHNGDKVQILAVTPVVTRGLVTVNTSAIISVPNINFITNYVGFSQAPTTNGLRLVINGTNQWAIEETSFNQQIGISVLVAVEREN